MGVFSSLFGGGGKTSAWPKLHEGDIEDVTRDSLMFAQGNRTGAKQIGWTKDYNGNKIPKYDYSNVGKTVSTKNAQKGYDFSGLDKAISKFSKGPGSISGATFDFARPDLIDEATANEYALGAGDLRREGQGIFDKTLENVGVRRPGLLLSASDKAGRNMFEGLEKLRMGLGGEALGQKLNLGKDQQTAQAEENYRVAQANKTNKLDWLKSLADASSGKVSLQGDVTSKERDYADKGLDYLKSIWETGITSRRGAGKQSSGGGGGVLGAVGKVAGTAGSIAKLF